MHSPREFQSEISISPSLEQGENVAAWSLLSSLSLQSSLGSLGNLGDWGLEIHRDSLRLIEIGRDTAEIR